jgi:N-acetylglucosamine-6-sulfatase
MRRKRQTRVALAALALAGAALMIWQGGEPERSSAATTGPNFVLITTDDQTLASLEVMKRTRSVLGDRGATFESYVASYPLCCPARATWITGQYPHNHGVIDNRPDSGGGYENLRDPERVLPVWLDAAGYDTALAGKWIHNYPGLRPPPGWDEWRGLVPATATSYYDYELADSAGGLVAYGTGESDYQTDVLTRDYTLPYIRAHGADPDPFFLHVSYTAPHWGVGRNDEAGRRCASPKPFDFDTARAKPAPRHANAFQHRKLPRPPSFNEEDLSDKPRIVRKEKPISRAERRDIARRYRCELASLLAVDEGVEQIVAELESAGLAGNTYVIYTSDNGYMNGEHRIRSGKLYPYEEAIRVPLLIRGPGIAAGTRVADPVADVDLVPTIAELARLAPPPSSARPQDGRSLTAQLAGERQRARAVLIEAKRPPRAGAGGAVARSFLGVRTHRYAYVERYELRLGSAEEGLDAPIGAGELVARELYDLRRDPYELDSLHRERAYRRTRATLTEALARLRTCTGPSCVLDLRVPPPERRR